QQIKDAELKKIEQEILPEVKKIRVKKEKVEREKAIFIKDYQFQINDTVRLKEGNAKGTVEKLEKNIATINYGLFTAKTDVAQIELVRKAKK
ncbi:MAG: DNA mismatch repair protein MutS, partial [Lutimonas sp.]